jgi:hypothetical protein
MLALEQGGNVSGLTYTASIRLRKQHWQKDQPQVNMGGYDNDGPEQ